MAPGSLLSRAPGVVGSSAAALVVSGVLLHASDASASGYLTARYGTNHGGAAMPNGFATYYNPAALGGTRGTTITGDLSLALRWAHYERTQEALSPSDASYKDDPAYVAANTGHANLLDLVTLPFVGVNTDFGTKNLHAGYAFYIPYGGSAKWEKREGVPGSPGSTDGVSRWHNISGSILALYNTFAVAYRIESANVSFGASVSPVIHSVSTVRARNGDGSDDTVVNNRLIEGRSYLKATGFNVGAAIGAYWEPTSTFRLGLSYTSQPGFGETRMTGKLRTQLAETPPDEKDIDFLQTYPDIVRLGAAFRALPELEIRFDADYQRWSVFKRQCVVAKGEKCDVDNEGRDLSNGKVILNVPRNWNDAVSFRLGPGWWVSDQLELHGGVAFSTPAVPKSTIDASTIDALRLDGTIGARYELNRHLAIDGSYTHLHYFTVNTNGGSKQNIPDHPANGPDGGNYNVSRSPSADGKYKSEVGFVNVNLAYTF
jgi:long-chain fatty acid transport protein